jgi:thiol-disulfide isomerase/thioredoxin
VNANAITKTKSVTGYGATATQYLFKQDSIGDKREYYKLGPPELLVYANNHTRLLDSLFNVVYTPKNNTDEYYDFFKKKIQLNNEFQRIDMLTYGIASDTTLTYKQSIDYINKNVKREILDDLYKKDFLISDAYVTMMNDGYYIYLLSLKKKSGVVLDNKRYRINAAQIISENYKGEIKDRALYSQLHQAVEFARSFEELNLYKKEFPQYMALLNKQSEHDAINQLTQTKEEQLLKTQVGKPAPVFTASDKDGKKYAITDYKGKVVLLDLWASWCEPCRQETPFLKKIAEKYKNESRLAFISVAVLDKKPNWLNAMAQDKPTWLQLFDSENTVQSAYLANSIPKFIIIDKQGNIVSFDAPMPHLSTELEKILDQEIAR